MELNLINFHLSNIMDLDSNTIVNENEIQNFIIVLNVVF